MKIVTIQIGNTDDKLSQEYWSKFVEDVRKCVDRWYYRTYFFGGSSNWETWQNVCWVISCREDRIDILKEELASIRHKYMQLSIAVTVGETEMV